MKVKGFSCGHEGDHSLFGEMMFDDLSLMSTSAASVKGSMDHTTPSMKLVDVSSKLPPTLHMKCVGLIQMWSGAFRTIRHHHTSLTILVMSGKGKLCMLGGTITFSKGDCLYIPPRTSYRFVVKSDMTGITFTNNPFFGKGKLVDLHVRPKRRPSSSRKA